MEDLVKELEDYFGAKAVLIDISCMEELRKRVREANQMEGLNDTQKFYTSDFYELALPQTDFVIQSILLFSFPFPAKTMAGFTVKGEIKKFPVCLENREQYDSVADELHKILRNKGYHIQFAPKLPRKMLAVSSGLAKYGRNNITYVEGHGSFHSLIPFYTDIPSSNTKMYPIERMLSCKECTLCAKLCPNHAIISERKLIDMERCMTYFNEDDSKITDFPDWINKDTHNSVIGCDICQVNCPQNRPYLSNEVLRAVFSEEETNKLLTGIVYKELSGVFKEKVDEFHIFYLILPPPRNLRVLLDKTNR